MCTGRRDVPEDCGGDGLLARGAGGPQQGGVEPRHQQSPGEAESYNTSLVLTCFPGSVRGHRGRHHDDRG